MTIRARLICAALLVVSSAALPSLANAREIRSFKTVDSKTGDVIFDDGVDDNKVCATKKVSKWDPAKQDFVEIQEKVKCNYQ